MVMLVAHSCSSRFCTFAFLPGQEWRAESKAAAAAQEKKRVEEAVEARLQISFLILFHSQGSWNMLECFHCKDTLVFTSLLLHSCQVQVVKMDEAELDEEECSGGQQNQ